jgi:signal transduction histidine kinase/DNA-binding response OmpR family regulator
LINMLNDLRLPHLETMISQIPAWTQSQQVAWSIAGLLALGIACMSLILMKALRRGHKLQTDLQRSEHEIEEQAQLLTSRNKELAAALENAQHLAHEANTATEAKGRFLANMSHEIRTPMNGVLGMTSLLADTPLTTEQQEFVRTIRTSSESLLGIINDILDYSKIESGQLHLESIPINLGDLVEEAFDIVAPSASRKNLALIADYAPEFPVLRMGDPTRIRQILINLIGNAVKFTASGEVTARLRDSDSAPGMLTIAIQDTGIGMPEEKLGQLFKPFSQLDASTARRFGGTGLGLVISRFLTESMGGTIGCTSIEGTGTTFLVQVPLPLAPERTKETTTMDCKGSILLVDPVMSRRQTMGAHFRSWGLDVTDANSSVEALSMLKAEPSRWNIAVVDYAAAFTMGTPMLPALRKLRAQHHIALVLITPAAAIPRLSRGLECGERLIPQPVHLSNLKEALCASLQSGASETTAASHSRMAPIEASEGIKHLHVLLAEDNTVNQKVALLVLRRLGIEADLAANGIEVLEALERQSYDVVLMDVQMPEMDGIEATKRIRSDFPADRQPYILAVTAAAAELDQESCRQSGMDAFLSKPFQPIDLISALQKVADLK